MGRTAIAAMLIGSGDKFLTWCAELIFRWRFSTIGKLTQHLQIFPLAAHLKSVGLSLHSSLHTALFIFATLQLVWLGGYMC